MFLFPQEVFFVPDGLGYQFGVHITKTTCDKGVMEIKIKRSFSNKELDIFTEMIVEDIFIYTLKKGKEGSLFLASKGELNFTGLLNPIDSKQFPDSQTNPMTFTSNSSQKKDSSSCPQIYGSFEGLYNNYHFTMKRKKGSFYYTLDIEPKFEQLVRDQRQYKFVCGTNQFQVIGDIKKFIKEHITHNVVVYNNQSLHFELEINKPIAYEQKHVVSFSDFQLDESHEFLLHSTNQLKTKIRQTGSMEMIFQK